MIFFPLCNWQKKKEKKVLDLNWKYFSSTSSFTGAEILIQLFRCEPATMWTCYFLVVKVPSAPSSAQALRSWGQAKLMMEGLWGLGWSAVLCWRVPVRCFSMCAHSATPMLFPEWPPAPRAHLSVAWHLWSPPSHDGPSCMCLLAFAWDFYQDFFFFYPFDMMITAPPVRKVCAFWLVPLGQDRGVRWAGGSNSCVSHLGEGYLCEPVPVGYLSLQLCDLTQS